jgi:hypothetical protein
MVCSQTAALAVFKPMSSQQPNNSAGSQGPGLKRAKIDGQQQEAYVYLSMTTAGAAAPQKSHIDIRTTASEATALALYFSCRSRR